MSIRSGVRTKGENPRYAVLLRVLILPRAHLLFLKPLVIGPNENHRIFIYLFFNKLLNLLSFIYTFFFLQIFGWVYYHSFVNWSITKCICAVFFKHVPHASVCIICTCAQRLPQQKQSKMIKIVSCCSVAVSFGGHEQWKVSQRVPRSPFSSLLTNTITNPVTVSVTLPDTMGVDFHALLGARPRKSQSMRNSLVMFCMCKYDSVSVGECLGARQGSSFESKEWELCPFSPVHHQMRILTDISHLRYLLSCAWDRLVWLVYFKPNVQMLYLHMLYA